MSEYLTYPLFAAIVGMGATLGRHQRFRSALIRGAVLVVVGLWLDERGTNVIIVLVYLGLLTWVMHPLARLSTPTIGVLGLSALVAAPPVRHSLLDERLQLYLSGHTTTARALDWVLTGDEYRLLSMIGFACLGIVLLREVRGGRLASRRRQTIASVCLLLASGVYVAIGSNALDLRPYEATWREHALCAVLVAGASLFVLALAPSLGTVTRALAAVGQMTLSLYAVQILYLAFYVHHIDPGAADDSWANLALLMAGATLLALGWRSVVPPGALGRGPIEGVTGLLVRSHLGDRTPRAATTG